MCPLDGRLLACLVLRPGRAHTVKHTGTDIRVSRAVEAREGKEGYIGYIGGGLSGKRKGREDGDGSGRIRLSIRARSDIDDARSVHEPGHIPPCPSQSPPTRHVPSHVSLCRHAAPSPKATRDPSSAHGPPRGVWLSISGSSRTGRRVSDGDSCRDRATRSISASRTELCEEARLPFRGCE